MTTFTSYFSLANIVGKLATARAKNALKRHGPSVYSHLFHSASPFPDRVKPFAHQYLPPRRQWARPNKKERKALSADQLATRSITRKVLGLYYGKRLPESEWGNNLISLVEKVQTRLSSQSHIKFEPPHIKLLSKPHTKAAKEKFRALATYNDIESWLLLGQTGKYLHRELDPLFSDASYAFRADSSRTHTAAVQKLQTYRLKYPDQMLYVAECDIQKFFDTVNHDVVRQAVQDIVLRAKQEKNLTIDSKALEIVEAYLASYSFYENVLNSKDEEIQEKLNKNQIDRVDPKKLDELYDRKQVPEIGIPQGGALSPFLTNCVLDKADRSVLQDDDPNLFYARFCDDMIIVHPDRAKCQQALNRYIKVMEDLKLLVHDVQNNIKYSADYYTHKSKGPYRWAASIPNRKNIPWIAFLGYQIRYDGQLRLRRQSIEKHCDNLVKEVGKTLKHLRTEAKTQKELKKDPQHILNVIERRIISMGVGKLSDRLRYPGKPQMCWAEAFPLLFGDSSNQYVLSQMRDLDRVRNKQLARLKKGSSEIAKRFEQSDKGKQTVSSAGSDNAGETNLSIKGKAKETPPFYGKPFSYVGVLQGNEHLHSDPRRHHSSFDAYNN